MKYKVFVDGAAGTTGLEINQRLSKRGDIEQMIIPEQLRKDPSERKKFIDGSDVTILCLPDDAAREAVQLCENPETVIIDASTAHRTNPDWAYGFPELGSEFADRIKTSKRICVPGCHASGFIALVSPLVKEGVLKKDELVSCTSLTGYSGGGNKMIAEYQSPPDSYNAPRPYSLALHHKHLPEMKLYSGLDNAPAFLPVVGNYYRGMTVTVPLFRSLLSGGRDEIKKIYSKYYGASNFLKVMDDELPDGGFIDGTFCDGTNNMQLFVLGNEQQLLLVARYDNLGKGASGAAIQCMNTALGCDERTGL